MLPSPTLSTAMSTCSGRPAAAVSGNAPLISACGAPLLLKSGSTTATKATATAIVITTIRAGRGMVTMRRPAARSAAAARCCSRLPTSSDRRRRPVLTEHVAEPAADLAEGRVSAHGVEDGRHQRAVPLRGGAQTVESRARRPRVTSLAVGMQPRLLLSGGPVVGAEDQRGLSLLALGV